ncbi:hypothetical protein L195_g004305, partial [Trifolium pratense]
MHTQPKRCADAVVEGVQASTVGGGVVDAGGSGNVEWTTGRGRGRLL